MKRLILAVGMIGCVSVVYAASGSCYLRRCNWYGLDDRRGKFDLCLRGGVGLNQIEAMTATLVSGETRPNYMWEPKCRMNPSVGFYCVYQRGMLGLDVGVEYFMLRSKTDKILPDRTETYSFDYSYAGLSASMRIYLYNGLYMGFGVLGGYNLTPGQMRVQSDWFLDYAGDELQLQKRMDETFTGQYTYGPTIKVGYDFTFGLSVAFEYYYGVEDHIAVADNNYDFCEVVNDAHRATLTIGYNFTIFDYETGRKEPGWKKWER